MKILRVYADTSVFGGCFDEEFALASKIFFNEIKEGRFSLVISFTTLSELDTAPINVQELVKSIPESLIETVTPSEEITRLRDAYLAANIVGPSSLFDAEHIASATVADVDMIVSWNFRHIVHFEKIRGYHGVNLLKGYRPIPIYSPREVIIQ